MPDDRLLVGVGDRKVGNDLTVFENNHPIGHARKLADPVADVQHPSATSHVIIDQGEKQLCLIVGEDRRRLVEDQQAGLLMKGTRDECELLLTKAQTVHPLTKEPQRKAQLREKVSSLGTHRRPSQIARTAS